MDRHDENAPGPFTAPAGENVPGDESPSFDELMTEFAELGNHAAEYAAVKVDLIRARLRGLALKIALGLCGLLIAVTTLVVLSFFAVRGVRGALEAVLGRPWVADLAVGAIGFGAAFAGLWLYRAGAAKRARERLVLKHEQRKSRDKETRPQQEPSRFAA